ncbi:MAG: hypothetical protein HY393_03515 [Candidatus Diapherotrites archaeon]|nr:hypothetical protein [Candidatus Diapherotrites archaeon]
MSTEELTRHVRRKMRDIHTPQDILKQAWGNRLWKLEGSQYRMLAPGEAMEWFNAKGRRTRPLHARKDPSGYPKMRPFRSAYYREEIRKRYGKFHPAFIERKEAEIKWLERHAAELKKQLPAFNVQPKTIKDILGLNEKIARYYTTLKLLYQARMKRLDSKKQFIHYDEKMPQRVKEALIRNIEPEEAATALDWSRKYKTYVRAMTRVDILQEHPELPQEEEKTINRLKTEMKNSRTALTEAQEEFELERNVYGRVSPELKRNVLENRLSYYKALNTLLVQYMKTLSLIGFPLVKVNKRQLKSAISMASAHIRALERTLGIRKK